MNVIAVQTIHLANSNGLYLMYNFSTIKGGEEMDKPKEKMTEEAARRIQVAADKVDTNQDWKARARKAADKNKKDN